MNLFKIKLNFVKVAFDSIISRPKVTIIMASSKLIFASALIVLSLINLSTSYFVEQTLSPNWFSSPENSQEKDKKFLNVLENVEIENLPILNKQLTTSSNNIDNYHEYQHSTCQLVNIIHLLKHTGCQPKAISSFACSGSCSSYVQVRIKYILSSSKNHVFFYH